MNVKLNVVFALIISLAGILQGQVTIEASATFKSVGLIVTFDTIPPENCTIETQIKTGTEDYTAAHSLSRISDNQFAGSFFYLEQDTEYSIHLNITNPSLQRDVNVRTRRDYFPDNVPTTIYVSKSGNDDTGIGTSGAPYSSIGRALQEVAAGTKILIGEGIYYESLTIPVSGTESNPIIIEGESGSRIILDGSDPEFNPASWENLGDGIFRASLGYFSYRVFHNEGHLYPYSSLGGLRDLIVNTDAGALVLNDSLYLKLPGNVSPAGEDIRVSRFKTGITCSRNYIQLKNMEIRFYGLSGAHQGVYFNGGSYNLVDDCTIHHNVIGVGFANGANSNTVQNSLFYETPIFNWYWQTGKPGSYERGSFYFYSSNGSCKENVIRNNVIHDMFEGAHLSSDREPTIGLDLHDNHFYNINDDCIETDGKGINIRIFNNRFEDCLVGISIAPAVLGPTYIIRNVIFNYQERERWPGEFWTGKSMKLNVGGEDVTSNVFLYHNTMYTSYTSHDGIKMSEPGIWENIISRNNIYHGQRRAVSNDLPNYSVDFDYDNLFKESTSDLVLWGYRIYYSTLAEFQNATGQEMHGFSVFPLYNNIAGKDFRLQSESPLIDQGVVIPGINQNYYGNGPDIGAFETGDPTSLETEEVQTNSTEFELNLFPNPSNSSLSIGFNIAKPTKVSIDIYDTRGRLVSQIVNEFRDTGYYDIIWNSNLQTSGTYFIYLTTEYKNIVKKITLVK